MYFVQKVVKMYLIYLYILVLDHIEFCKVVLNTCKVNMEYSLLHFTQFNIYFLSENVKKLRRHGRIYKLTLKTCIVKYYLNQTAVI